MSPPEPEFGATRRTGISARETSIVLITALIFGGIIWIVSPFSFSEFIRQQREGASVLAAHNLALALFNSAIDHGNTYPVGAKPSSSTSTFQLLLNQKYLDDPAEVYLNGNGRVAYSGPQPPVLKPENVAWDYVEQKGFSPLTGSTPLGTPLILSTGLGPQAVSNGPNPVAITDQAVWGTNGITVAYLDQSTAFVHSHPPVHVVVPYAPVASPIHPYVNLTDKSYYGEGGHWITTAP